MSLVTVVSLVALDLFMIIEVSDQDFRIEVFTALGIIVLGVSFFGVAHEWVGRISAKVFGVTNEEAKATFYGRVSGRARQLARGLDWFSLSGGVLAEHCRRLTRQQTPSYPQFAQAIGSLEWPTGSFEFQISKPLVDD